MTGPEREERETRRIILLRLPRGRDPEVLLGREGARHTLPEVRVACFERLTEQLTAALQETFSIDAVSISSLQAQPAGPRPEQIPYEIMEARGTFKGAPNGERWVSVSSLAEDGFLDPNDFQAVREALSESVHAGSRGPFTHLGWFDELEHWVEEQIRPRGLALSGRFRQLNACPTFSLIRFETTGPAVWFKAVGHPNEREYALTLGLACSFSKFLPQVIARRPESNGWLSLEAEGPLLDESPAFRSWEMAARDLARLEIDSLDRCVDLLGLGARDLSRSALAELVEPFLEVMGVVMECQPKTPPPRLSRDELHILSARVQDALSLLEKTGIPKTLGHLDLNPGNIVCSPEGSVFLDWAEGFVGHPFLSFEYLRQHFRRTFGLNRSEEAELTACFTAPWRSFASEDQIRLALRVIPLVAVFACAVGDQAWKDPRRLEEPRTAAYLRSLTRRMEREADAFQEWSAPCPH